MNRTHHRTVKRLSILALVIPLVLFGRISIAQEFEFTDTQSRSWTFGDGSDDMVANLVAYNQATKVVVLARTDRTSIEVPYQDLSISDRRYVSRQASRAKRAIKRALHNKAKETGRAPESRPEETRLNPTTRPTAINDHADTQHLYGITWHNHPEQAASLATGVESVSDDKPILWFRVLGDLSGGM